MDFDLQIKKGNSGKMFLTLVILSLGITFPHYSCTDKIKTNDTRAEVQHHAPEANKKIIPGAERMNEYLPLLKGKNIALVVNHTSLINSTHLADTLLALNINIKKLFSPEHGIRGQADAGEKIKSETDARTGLPIVSLYGNNKKPAAEHLKDVDIVLFDIQDAGARFYTYISTMHYMMEACAENDKEMLILDRPNPNGFYVDGPMMEPAFTSFVGMHPIPVVHGLTVGELAMMINGEGWLKDGMKCRLKVILTENYSHKSTYILPVRPSPNLPNQQSIYLYPSLCFFEGTQVSVGRGTAMPFQVYGMPDESLGDFTFTPASMPGAKNPPHEGKLCYGKDLREEETEAKINLSYLINAYNSCTDKEKFFNNFFSKLAGNALLQQQIIKGMSEEEIRNSWQEDLNKYKAVRKKYLLYEDF